MDSDLTKPIQCTGCDAKWDEVFVEMYCDGDSGELQKRHRQRRCWRYPHEAYHHEIVDIRTRMDLNKLKQRVVLGELTAISESMPGGYQ